MSESDQIVIQCPACGGKLRAPRAAIGSQVGCPTCQAAITVREPQHTGPVPMIVDPSRRLGSAPRGESAGKSDGSFKDRLRTTAEPTFQVDPDNPVMKRRDWRRQKHGETLTDWDRQTPRMPRRHRRTRKIMIGLAGACGILTLVLAGIFWQRVGQGKTMTSAITGNSAPRPLEHQASSDFRDDVWEVTQQFCSAPTAEALLPFVREPERVGPLIKRYYNSENPWFPIALAPRPDLSDLQVHRDFAVFELPLADYSTRPLALEQTPEGFKVDWESFVGYCEMPWEQLRRTKPRHPVMVRAVVRPSDYFNRDFPSAETHRSYQISDEDGDHVLYGYVPLKSDVALQLIKTLLNSSKMSAVLRIRYPENSTNDRQVEITEVLEQGWIFREDDYPETSLDTDPPGLSNPAPEDTKPKRAAIPSLTSP